MVELLLAGKVSVHSDGQDYLRNRPEVDAPKACFGEVPDLASKWGWGEYIMCQLRKTDLLSDAFFGIDERWRLFEYTFAGKLNEGINVLRVPLPSADLRKGTIRRPE